MRRFGLVFALMLFLAACNHKPATVSVPAAPPIQQPSSTPSAAPTTADSLPAETIPVPPEAKPILTETGIASWYGPPYHNRRGSNGEIYDMHAMTAAHKTLPLGSIVRVTNLATGHSAVVRINDRGPFIGTRIIDLSLAAAKAVDVWRAGEKFSFTLNDGRQFE